jgi:NADH-ubiquinone oxidoreductase chain 2
MIAIGLSTIFLAVGLLRSVTSTHFVRIAAVTLLAGALLALDCLHLGALEHGLPAFSGLFAASGASQLLTVFVLLTGAGIVVAVWPEGARVLAEYPVLALFAVAGGALLVASADLISMYLALELQSFAVYVLAALYRDDERATGAGLTYFLLGALSSALILLGVAVVYSQTGLTSLSLGLLGDGLGTPVAFGLLLALAGFLFKVAAAPLHNWAPDVYDGAPTVVATWLTAMPKLGILGFLLAALHALPLSASLAPVVGVLGASAALSLLIGTTLGLAQTRVKRLLAYSTINNVAYLLLALAVGGDQSTTAFVFYLMQYTLVNLTAFLALIAAGGVLSRGADIAFISELRRLGTSAPMIAVTLGLALFSMAGVPPLVGFFGKFLVLDAALAQGYYALTALAILTSVVAAAYYLRVVRVMAFDPTTPEVRGGVPAVQAYALATLSVLALLFLAYPAFILNSLALLAT